MRSVTATRVERLHDLADVYDGDWTPDKDGAPTEELAASPFAWVVRRTHDSDGFPVHPDDLGCDYFVGTSETVKDAVARLEQDAETWEPVAIIDLDTGRTTPVKTELVARVTTGEPFIDRDLPWGEQLHREDNYDGPDPNDHDDTPDTRNEHDRRL